jgi:hypothetical protein
LEDRQSRNNGKVATTDGPYAETKEQLGGIGFLEARDMNHALQLLTQHPALKYGTVFEIRPAADLNEMMKASSVFTWFRTFRAAKTVAHAELVTGRKQCSSRAHLLQVSGIFQ